MSYIFKNGDKVYVPLFSTKIHIVQIINGLPSLFLDNEYICFLEDGRMDETDISSSLFLATENSKYALELLSGIKFEDIA